MVKIAKRQDDGTYKEIDLNEDPEGFREMANDCELTECDNYKKRKKP